MNPNSDSQCRRLSSEKPVNAVSSTPETIAITGTKIPIHSKTKDLKLDKLKLGVKSEFFTNDNEKQKDVSFEVTIPPPPSSNHFHVKLPNAKASIIYTETDEAPSLATYSLLPCLSKVSCHYIQFLY